MSNEITAVILAKNEERNIKECLDLLKWVDKIVLIDDYSTDETIEIVKRYDKAKIYQRNLNSDFSAQRNFAITKVDTEWVLFVDADERIPEELKNEIIGILNFNNLHDAYEIKRIDVMWGKKIRHGEQGSTRLTRLFKKQSGEYYGKIHEEVRIKGKIGRLNNAIIHFPHQSVREFLEEINFYSGVRASELYDNGVKTNGLLILCYTLGKFIKNYFFMFGVLDGIRGLVLAIFMSLHSFLSRGKLWLLWRKK
jgi:glycosyltransferase involved in cell wall biosynthesis